MSCIFLFLQSQVWFKLQTNCLSLDVVTMALVVIDHRKPEDKWRFFQCGFCAASLLVDCRNCRRSRDKKETWHIADWKRLRGTGGGSHLENYPNRVVGHAWSHGPIGEPNKKTKPAIIFGSTPIRSAENAWSN